MQIAVPPEQLRRAAALDEVVAAAARAYAYQDSEGIRGAYLQRLRRRASDGPSR